VLLNESLKSSLSKVLSGGDTARSRHLIEKIIQKISSGSINDSVLSESYYLIGIYYLLTKSFNESIRYLDLCIAYKVKNGEYDERYARALYNIGLAYLNLGDFKKHEEYSSRALEAEKKINGESNPILANIYFSLGSAYIELQEYEKALNYLNIALTISNSKPDSVSHEITADLYESMGVCYSRLADFSKAKIYLDKSESLYKQFNLKINDNYINLMNSSAITYGALKLTAEAGEYYKKVIPIAIANNSPMAYNIINSYSIFLANSGDLKRGEELLIDALERAKTRSKSSPRSYIEVLINYANYLRDNNIDNKKSLKCFGKCL
jgi:tetratricopeptide (TPR) repeat protein